MSHQAGVAEYKQARSILAQDVMEFVRKLAAQIPDDV